MSSESKIEKEILGFTKTKPKRGEERQDYLERLMYDVQKLSNQQWDDLGHQCPEAQDWVNKAADAVSDKKDIEDFPELRPTTAAVGARARATRSRKSW
jgi:hypothetical protein